METPIPIKNVITYSDGSETVINYKPQEPKEATVEELAGDVVPEEVKEEVKPEEEKTEETVESPAEESAKTN